MGKVNGNDEVITSLTFVTNKKSYGPYGKVRGRGFETSSDGKVVGYFGKSGSQLNQIGVIKKLVVEQEGHWEGTSWNEFFGRRDRTVDLTVVQGPWGGQGGTQFYHGRGDILELVITHNESHILSFQATYDQGGVDFQADSRGPRPGDVATVSYYCSTLFIHNSDCR